jgi:cytochrome bd-type quinol oxidase subunit 2
MNIIKSVAANEIIINDEVKQNIPNISAGDAQIIQLFNTAYLWAGIICVAIIIVSGILYTTSAGNSDRIKTAKNAITYAVVGIVIILLAFTITNFVIGKV